MVRIYNRYATVYDKVFERFFFDCKIQAISSETFPKNARILDIGLGSGMSLKLFPSNAKIVGIDISLKMLQEAEKKASSSKKDITLIAANGEKLPFRDNSFDFIFMSHVLSVLPNPEHALSEIHRTVKKDGQIVIINAFLSRNPLLCTFQRAINPVCYRLGWKNNISLNRFNESNHFDLESVRKHKKHSLWTILKLKPL